MSSQLLRMLHLGKLGAILRRLLWLEWIRLSQLAIDEKTLLETHSVLLLREGTLQVLQARWFE